MLACVALRHSDDSAFLDMHSKIPAHASIRLVEKEMIVQDADVDATRERGFHRRVHFVMKHHEVADRAKPA